MQITFPGRPGQPSQPVATAEATPAVGVPAVGVPAVASSVTSVTFNPVSGEAKSPTGPTSPARRPEAAREL